MKYDVEKREWRPMTRGERLRETVEAAAEAVCAVFVFVAFVLSLWLYCALTPPQASAQCDLLRAEMEEAQ